MLSRFIAIPILFWGTVGWLADIHPLVLAVIGAASASALLLGDKLIERRRRLREVKSPISDDEN